ncbi:Flp family type IVb pilin [Vibrio splendidus]|uniref:Flp family type IVb pilin n=1 Tax=Vibrio splendidus TaxID=29497 RepID=UPI0006CA2ED5|nr:Flp family type IVb pilin [Vibrio splendidus]KPL96817.1 pilin [Vibrio splendidus]
MLLNINSKIRQIRTKFKLDKRGVTAVEYAIIAVAMSAILLGIFQTGTLKGAMEGAMNTVSSSLSGGAPKEAPKPGTQDPAPKPGTKDPG